MADDDRDHWDTRYKALNIDAGSAPEVPGAFVRFESEFPTTGTALDVACGRGLGATWLAARGMDVFGIDVSSNAIAKAQDLALGSGVSEQCRFAVVDLDGGLPDGPRVDVVLCHMFRGDGLEDAIVARLAPGGLLAVAWLSEVDSEPGRFRAQSGELRRAFERFDTLDIFEHGEGNGRAWLLARRDLSEETE